MTVLNFKMTITPWQEGYSFESKRNLEFDQWVVVSSCLWCNPKTTTKPSSQTIMGSLGAIFWLERNKNLKFSLPNSSLLFLWSALFKSISKNRLSRPRERPPKPTYQTPTSKNHVLATCRGLIISTLYIPAHNDPIATLGSDSAIVSLLAGSLIDNFEPQPSLAKADGYTNLASTKAKSKKNDNKGTNWSRFSTLYII